MLRRTLLDCTFFVTVGLYVVIEIDAEGGNRGDAEGHEEKDIHGRELWVFRDIGGRGRWGNWLKRD